MQELLFHVAVGLLAQKERAEWRGIVGRVRDIEGGGVNVSERADGRRVGMEKETEGKGTNFGRVWRPQILAVILPHGTEESTILHPRLISFIAQLRARSGLCILSSIVTPKEIDAFTARHHHVGATSTGRRAKDHEYMDMTEEVVFRRRLMLLKAMREEGVIGFTKVFTSPSVRVGQSILLQTVGCVCCSLSFHFNAVLLY